MPQLSVPGFEGPLDFLLEVVRRRWVDLARLPIAALMEQCTAALERSADRVPLERRADWLVLASQLLLLRTRLLARPDPDTAEDEAAEAGRRDPLAELAAMRAAASWLARQPQLGRDVFARGRRAPPDASPQAELYVAFLEATLVLLEGRDRLHTDTAADDRPALPPLWRVAQAMVRLSRLLDAEPAGLTLEQCLPAIPPDAVNRPLQVRAAVASTLAAGLELARTGSVVVAQEGLFESVRFAKASAALGSRDAAV